MFLRTKKSKILKIIFLASLIFIFSGPSFVSADTTNTSTTNTSATNTSASSSVHSGLEETANAAGIPKQGASSIPTRIGTIISEALGFVGVIFLVLMIIGGLMWMTAAGNEQRVEKAKVLITNAVIGMIIVFSAYAITYFVTNTLLGS